MKKRNSNNIGLTGSNGFLGSAILEHLKNRGYNVIVLDSLVHPDIKDVSVNDIEALDWVLHFGASKSIEASFQNPLDTYRRNMHSTITALDTAVASKARFLYMSSYVYGKPYYLPIDEKHSTYALNPYMGSKLLGEQICYQLHQSIDFSALILRGFTFYGPQQKGNQLIPSVIDSIKKNRPIVVKDPNPKRDYLHVIDLIRLIDMIILSNFTGHEVYNIGGGKAYRNIEIAQMANKLVGNPVQISVEGIKRRNDVNECYANIEKVKRDFQWEPKIDLSDGLYSCLF
jgi:UDP-glucose 4-epimerase